MAEKLILVADDDRDLVTALSIRLQATGYEVIGAHDGDEAYEMAQEQKPDLVIMDIRMPAGGGLDSTDRLKHSLSTRNIPVIFLTAFDDEDMKEQARTMGCAGYFRKPFDDAEFMESIRKVLGS